MIHRSPPSEDRRKKTTSRSRSTSSEARRSPTPPRTATPPDRQRATGRPASSSSRRPAGGHRRAAGAGRPAPPPGDRTASSASRGAAPALPGDPEEPPARAGARRPRASAPRSTRSFDELGSLLEPDRAQGAHAAHARLRRRRAASGCPRIFAARSPRRARAPRYVDAPRSCSPTAVRRRVAQPRATDLAARQRLRPLLGRASCPSCPGSSAAPRSRTTHGRHRRAGGRTLGRGGSDLTATLLGRALGAREVSLWKDVPGLLTADPRVVPDARVIPQLHAARGGRARLLRREGAAPARAHPARQRRRLPVFVRPFADPDARRAPRSRRGARSTSTR